MRALTHQGVHEKGPTLRTGQTHVQRYLPQPLLRVGNAELQPHSITNHHRLALADAARAYAPFDRKLDACHKVVLRSGAP